MQESRVKDTKPWAGDSTSGDLQGESALSADLQRVRRKYHKEARENKQLVVLPGVFQLSLEMESLTFG